VTETPRRRRHLFPSAARAGVLFLTALLFSSPLSARSQEIDRNLEELRRLIRDKDYRTALEDLEFIAQRIQDLRIARVQPFFPDPPQGWQSSPPLRISGVDEPWVRHLEVRRTYRRAEGSGKIDIVFDFASPLLPAVTMSLNPVYIAGDPFSRPLEKSGFPGRLRFNPDTGEGEVTLILDKRIIVSVIGRGVPDRDVLEEFTALVDLESLAALPPP
jgi:hypothetical protein